MALSVLLFLFFTMAVLLGSGVLQATRHEGFRMELSRRDTDLPIATRIQNSHLRARYLASKAAKGPKNDDAAVLMTSIGDAFTLPLFFGSPAQRLDVVFDTGSDLVWVECQRLDLRFNYSRSSTFRAVNCSDIQCYFINDYCEGYCTYEYAYGGGSVTTGVLSTDGVSLVTSNGTHKTFPRTYFGCSFSSVGFAGMHGIVGFGRGSMSLISQLSNFIENKFSYCLSAYGKSSPFFFGSTADIHSAHAQTIPLLSSDTGGTYYYVNLTSITAAATNISMPMSESEYVNTIFDSGTTVSFFPPGVYNRVRQALSSHISLPRVNGSSIGLDLCYNVSLHRNYIFPSLTLHFQDAVLRLDQENYFMIISRADVEAWNESVACLAMASSANYGINIIGNVMQQGHHIMFDNERSSVTFASATCSEI